MGSWLQSVLVNFSFSYNTLFLSSENCFVPFLIYSAETSRYTGFVNMSIFTQLCLNVLLTCFDRTHFTQNRPYYGFRRHLH